MATAASVFAGSPINVTHLFDEKIKSNNTPNVFLIGDNPSAELTLRSIVGPEGWQLETFECADEFLARPRPLAASCLILTLRHSDSNGIEVQKRLTRERAEVPIVILSGYADIPTTVQALKAGAVDFLLHPFGPELLLDAIRASLERSRRALHREMEISNLRNCYASLSRRERQVMTLVVSGLLNKQVGGELGISEITVKAHRRQLMTKMKANSLPHLVRIALELGVTRKAISSDYMAA